MTKIRHAILTDLKELKRESMKDDIAKRVSAKYGFTELDVLHEIEMLRDEDYLHFRQTAQTNTYWIRLKEKGEEYFLPRNQKMFLYIARHWLELATLAGALIAAIGTIIQLCRGQ